MAKKYKKTPSPRHRIVAENIGKGQSMYDAILNAGFSKSYARSPEKLRNSMSWQQLMKEDMKENIMMDYFRLLMSSKTVQKFIYPSRMKDEEIQEHVNAAGFTVIVIRPSPIGKMAYYSIPNSRAITDGLNYFAKLGGKLSPETLNLEFAGYNKEQLIDFILEGITTKKKS